MAFRFEELLVYKTAQLFFCDINKIVIKWPTIYRFNLVDQLLRASLSIILNIAEGSSRTPKDFQHFLSISRGSCYESLAILSVAYELKLLSKIQYDQYRDQLDHIARMLSSLKNKI